jgi:pimeloyl-ACP methyl ester carboxylesterase
MKLAYTAYGEGSPILIAHGLFGSGRNWTGFAKSVSGDRRAITVDLRNHGESAWVEAMNYPAMGNDLLALIDAKADGSAVMLGHSMGGKAAMAAALTQPKSISALIVVDIAPVVYEQSHVGYVDALQAIDLDKITRRAEADTALAESIPEPGLRQFLLQNLDFGDARPRWKLNLEAILSNMAALMDFPFDAAAGHYDGPALFVAGGNSGYIGQDHQAAIRGYFPNSQIEVIDDAGHWVHVEKPVEFGALVASFLNGLPRA